MPRPLDFDPDQLSQQVARHLQYFHRDAYLLCYVYDVRAYLLSNIVQRMAGNVNYGQRLQISNFKE